VLLADEPTGNLDTAAAREVVSVLRERHADGQTIVLVTHDMRVASAAQRVVAMRDGRIVGETLPAAGDRDVLSRVVSLEA
jgi:ABC-type lipoprotein export system ATPase subunit